jgi:hypothetical protein
MKYRKKPVVIEAVQWTGSNLKECLDFGPGVIQTEQTPNGRGLVILTLGGLMVVSINDYIIRGVQGEYYPCKPDIFKETYEEVNNG